MRPLFRLAFLALIVVASIPLFPRLTNAAACRCAIIPRVSDVETDVGSCDACVAYCSGLGGGYVMTHYAGGDRTTCPPPAPPPVAPTCACTTDPQPAGSPGDLVTCCTFCRDAHGGTVQTEVLFNSATEACTGAGAAPSGLTSPPTGGVVGPGGGRGAPAPTLPNPLGGTTDIRTIIGRVISAALGISGSIALLMFIWGGMLWLTSGGSPERIKKGKDAIVWAVLGLVLIFGSYAILNFVLGAILSA